MATIAHDALQLSPRAVVVNWTPLANGDDGEPYSRDIGGADRSVQVAGTFGAGGTLVIEGSNDPDPLAATWFTLTDPQGNALSFPAARLEQVAEYTRWLRPRVTGGDGTTALTVRMFVGV
ncbi:MAG: hypothetical protein K2X74_00435 [Acetobacteraceae bacterium]|nr:hypothetical protein [Acetobacteraceae bacterium]